MDPTPPESNHMKHQSSTSSSSSISSSKNPHAKNLIINYLSSDIHEYALMKRFSKYGTISHVKIARNPTNGNSLTYGFVHFKREEDARNAIELENGAEWNGKHIRVSVARAKKDHRYCKIIISNIDPRVTEDSVKSLFHQFGHIIELRFVRSHSSQLCFIEYDTMEQCLEAMTMDSKILEGTTSPLTIQLATRDYFDRRIETLKDSSPIDFNSNRLSPFDITMNGISHWESSPPYAFSLPLMLNPSTMSQAVTQFTCDYVFEVSGLAPTVTALQLCTIFSQYGQVIAFRLHTNIIGSISLCSGTATLRLYGSIQLRDYALATLNGAHVPQLEGPIFVSLL